MNTPSPAQTLTLIQTDTDGRRHTILVRLDGSADLSRLNEDGGSILSHDLIALMLTADAWCNAAKKL